MTNQTENNSERKSLNIVIQEIEKGFKFNYSNKQKAIKNLQTEQDFKSLGIEVYN